MEGKTEHVFLSDPIYDKICMFIYKSYPNACVIEILKVVPSKAVEEKYDGHFAMMKSLYDDTESVKLFHGTSPKFINGIVQEGFLVSENRVSAYGVGTYFSNNPLIANTYAQKHLKRIKDDLSYVVYADCVISKTGTIVGSSSYRSPKEGISCYVNRIANPDYFCIPWDNGAIPRYIISFNEQTKS